MSDTPRTDGLTVLAQLGMIPACNIVPAVFDRQLKRELDSSNTVSATLLATKCRELAEVTKERDELVRAIRKHKQTLAFTLDYCDVELYKALEELEEGGAQ